MFELSEFRKIYKQAVKDILPYFDRDKLDLIAKHNWGWRSEVHDVAYYLYASEERYVHALELYGQQGSVDVTGISVLDVGGFMAAFPLALGRMGVKVTLAEKYSYYYGAFDALRAFLEDEKIIVWDEDFADRVCMRAEKFDLVTNMAVLEHLASSPKVLLENLKRHTKAEGKVIVEVPNIAYWPKRLKLLLGETIHPDIDDLYLSEPPFIGHHREYSRKDLLRVIELAGLKTDELIFYNYTPWPKGNWKQKLLLEWPVKHIESCREILMVMAAREDESAI